jgi:curli biogenesis system outer membrane secretion channel CsgG
MHAHPVLARLPGKILIVALAAPVLAVAVIAAPSLAAEPGAVCSAYHNQDYDQALILAAKILAADPPAPAKVDVFKCQTCTYVALRRRPEAKGSVAEMLQADPTARFSPEYNYPPPVIEIYNVVRDSVMAHGSGPVDARTIAIGDFEDNSVYTGKFKGYDFSLFKNALVHTLTADLAEATDLKIVDRQRTQKILEEIQLSQSSFTDPKQAVAAGKLLGAQTFVFGQYMILSAKKVRIDARVVRTSTGEVLLTRQVTGEFGGDPERFLALERELVEGLAEGIDQVLSANGQAPSTSRAVQDRFAAMGKTISKREGYVEAKFLAAEALELEDKGNYAAATRKWEEVRRMDPANDVASARLSALSSLAMN